MELPVILNETLPNLIFPTILEIEDGDVIVDTDINILKKRVPNRTHKS